LTLPKGKKTDVVTAAPSEQTASQELYNEASKLKQEGDIVKAKETYQTIISEHSDFGDVEKVQEELEDLNIQMIFSNTAVEGKTFMHKVQVGDTLGEIAKQYGTTVELIQRSNNISGNIIRIGQQLRIWTAPFNILVDKSQNILILKDGNDVIKVYNVSTGENNSTPVGEFTIISKLIDPVWFNKGIVVPPESPQNVLGSRWLGFDIPGYGIHGTIEPETIGQQVTAGCVRMRNEEVEELYSIVSRGTKVVIVD
jgi:lipoprotein-anchoring transpeptidase ErfK/SrfK